MNFFIKTQSEVVSPTFASNPNIKNSKITCQSRKLGNKSFCECMQICLHEGNPLLICSKKIGTWTWLNTYNTSSKLRNKKLLSMH